MSLRSLVTLLLAFSSLSFAQIIKSLPDESTPLLRRDLLPLDLPQIETLSAQLISLANHAPAKSLPARQDQVQMLILSERLFPAQLKARTLLQTLQGTSSNTLPPRQPAPKAYQAILRTADWLLQMPLSSEGYRLGQLLLDSLAHTLPSHPLILRRDAPGEPARWQNILPDFHQPTANKATTPPKTAPLATPVKPSTPEIKEPTPPSFTPVQSQAILFMRQQPKDRMHLLQLTPIHLRPTGSQAPLNFRSADLKRKTSTLKTLNALQKSPTTAWPPLLGLEVTFADQEKALGFHSTANILAPLAMLIDSSVSKRPLRPATTILAGLTADGMLTRGSRFWESIHHLHLTPAPTLSRIIIAPESVEDLLNFLVLDHPKFFVNYEIIAAPTLSAAREYFYQDGKPEKSFNQAHDRFQVLRQNTRNVLDLGVFLLRGRAQTELQRLHEMAPAHISISLLHRCVSDRPAYFERPGLLRELARILDPITDIPRRVSHGLTVEPRDIYRQARADLATLDRKVASSDRPFLEESIALTIQLQGLKSFEERDYYEKVKTLRTDFLRKASQGN